MIKKFIKNHLGIFINSIIIFVELFLFFLCLILKNDPYICEWWTRNISRGYQTVIGALTKYIPFSFMEMLIVSLVISTFIISKLKIDTKKLEELLIAVIENKVLNDREELINFISNFFQFFFYIKT